MSATVFNDDQPPSTQSTEVPRVNGQFEAPDEDTPVNSTAAPDLMLALAKPETTKQAFDRTTLLRGRALREWPVERRPTFVLKQEWIGRVDAVSDDAFAATLVTRSSPDDIEHAEIEIDEVAPRDRVHLRPGAVFYWVIGYRDEPYGQRLGVSSIIFRKMTEPTPEALVRADAAAERALAALNRKEPESQST
jgi:hypothetical protein